MAMRMARRLVFFVLFGVLLLTSRLGRGGRLRHGRGRDRAGVLDPRRRARTAGRAGRARLGAALQGLVRRGLRVPRGRVGREDRGDHELGHERRRLTRDRACERRGRVRVPLQRRDHRRLGEREGLRLDPRPDRARPPHAVGDRGADGLRTAGGRVAECPDPARGLGLHDHARAGHRHELAALRCADVRRLHHGARRPSDGRARRPSGRIGDPGRLCGEQRAGRRPGAGQAGRARSRQEEEPRVQVQARQGRPAAPCPFEPAAEADRRRLRLPGLRAFVVRGHLRGVPRRRARELAPRRRHLRSARRADPRLLGRDRLLGRLERDRRQPPVAPRLAGQRVLLRAPLGLLAAGEERPARQGGRGARLRRQHGRRGRDADAPALRGASGLADLHGLRRGGEPDAVPDRVEAPPGRALPERRGLGSRGSDLGSRRRSRRRSCCRSRTSPRRAVSIRARWSARSHPRRPERATRRCSGHWASARP